MNTYPIGIFDSGLGGLSVWKELLLLLPHESLIYYADSANCPYGEKPKEEIIRLSVNIVDFLLEKKCKLIVVACNTATSAAIRYLRDKYALPFVGMEPAIKPAALQTKSGKVGVLATKGTLNGDIFKNTSNQYAEGMELSVQVGEGLVELVEAGKFDTPEAETALRKFIEPMLEAQIDQIVLGCTHYPLLLSQIEKISEGKANIINPAPAVARQSKNILFKHHLTNDTFHKAQYAFYSNGDLTILKKLVNKIAEGDNQKYCFERLGDS